MEEYIKVIEDSKKNIIINGSLSSGKTTNIMFPLVHNMIDRKENLFVLDAKEEYINYFYDDLKKYNYNIITINFRDINKSEGWNPFKLAFDKYKNNEKEDALEEIKTIVNIVLPHEKNNDPFWVNCCRELMTGLILCLFEDGEENTINFLSITKMLETINDKYGDSNCLEEYVKSKGINSKPYLFTASTLEAPNDTKSSILSVIKTKLNTYSSSDKMNKVTSKTTFNFSKKPYAIFLITKDEEKNAYNTLSSIFIKQLYELIVNNNHQRTNMIIDNYDLLDCRIDYKTMLSSSISRDIKLFILTRDYKLMLKKYTEYINRLCDVVDIKNKIIIKQDDEESTYSKNFIDIKLEKNKYDFYSLDFEEVKYFDIKDYLDKKITKTKKSLSDVISMINQEIDEKNSNKEVRVTSDFSKFRI